MANIVEISLLNNFIDRTRKALRDAGINVDKVEDICDIPVAIKERLDNGVPAEPAKPSNGLISGAIITSTDAGKDEFTHERYTNVNGTHSFEINGLNPSTMYLRLITSESSTPVYIDLTPLIKLVKG